MAVNRNWERKCDARIVPAQAIIKKLQALLDAGVDIDALPLDWDIQQLMDMPIPDKVA